MPVNETRPILFLCSTYFQLMSSINIKITEYENRPADLLLTDTSDFSNQVERIRESKVFRNVYQCKVTDKMVFLSTLSVKEREKHTDPTELYKDVGLQDDYADLYMTVSRLSCSLYYYFIHKGTVLNVHLYEDGPISYYLNLDSKLKNDGLSHEKYGQDRLTCHIVESLYYAPELYSGPEYAWPVNIIVKPNKNLVLAHLMDMIFGKQKVPDERYIFMGESNAGMYLGNLYSDFLVMEQIAKIVGKENIAVKLHPRSPVDRFTPAGYKVMENRNFPWELALFGQNLDDKVLLTIRSTSVITPLTLFEQKNKIISFANLVRGNDVSFWDEKYINKLKKRYNAHEKTICFPKTEQELTNDIYYFEGKARLHELNPEQRVDLAKHFCVGENNG